MKHIVIILILVIFASSVGYFFFDKEHVDGKSQYSADEVILDLETAIAHATEKGDYHCCINPACTMCYLGSWIFEKGKCNCDEMIARGEWDKVCPECKKGIEDGNCSSTQDAVGCEIDQKNHE